MIFIYIKWLYLRSSTLCLQNIISISVNYEQPYFSVEHRTAKFIKNTLTAYLSADISVNSFVISNNPGIMVVISNNISKIWHPHISIIEEHHSHVCAVGGEELMSINSVNINSGTLSAVQLINCIWSYNQTSIYKGLWIQE